MNIQSKKKFRLKEKKRYVLNSSPVSNKSLYSTRLDKEIQGYIDCRLAMSNGSGDKKH